MRRNYKEYFEIEGSHCIAFKDLKGLYLFWIFDLRALKKNPSAQPFQVMFNPELALTQLQSITKQEPEFQLKNLFRYRAMINLNLIL